LLITSLSRANFRKSGRRGSPNHLLIRAAYWHAAHRCPVGIDERKCSYEWFAGERWNSNMHPKESATGL